MKKRYRYYRLDALLEIPTWVDSDWLITMLVKLVEHVGGFMGGGFVECDKSGKAVKHVKKG